MPETAPETPSVVPAPTEAAQPTETTVLTETPPKAVTERPSVLNEPPAAGAPEKYEAFNVPEGYEMDPEVLAEASGMFRELGLPQTAAQKLVDFYAAKSLDAAQAPVKYYQEKQEEWIAKVKADPEIGGKLDTVRTTIGRALDGLGDPQLAREFREAMDFTGAGNNPAFIRTFYRLAQKVTEGTTHVTGSPRGTTERPRNAAQAIYPNLPSASGG